MHLWFLYYRGYGVRQPLSDDFFKWDPLV